MNCFQKLRSSTETRQTRSWDDHLPLSSDACDKIVRLRRQIFQRDAYKLALFLNNILLRLYPAIPFVAITGMDEENIIMSLFAKTQNVDKVIAKVNEDSRAQMVEALGIDITVSAKSAAADAISSYVKARMNSYSSANIETMYRLVNGRIHSCDSDKCVRLPDPLFQQQLLVCRVSVDDRNFWKQFTERFTRMHRKKEAGDHPERRRSL